MGRPSAPDAATGVREALIAKLAGHVRQTYDPRLVLGLEAGEEPEDDPEYVDYTADMYDDLVAGRAVNVASWRMRGIAEVPAGCYSVRVDVDGTVSPAPRDEGPED